MVLSFFDSLKNRLKHSSLLFQCFFAGLVFFVLLLLFIVLNIICLSLMLKYNDYFVMTSVETAVGLKSSIFDFMNPNKYSFINKTTNTVYNYDFKIISQFLGIIINIVEYLIYIIPVLFAVAMLTLLERKILGSTQRRKGPSVVGFVGALQAFADGMKLFFKESVVPIQSSKITFLIAPVLSLALSFMPWAVVPIYPDILPYADFDFALLYIFAISSLGVYGIILAGWSSKSKYSFLGALRSAAQMISYEVSIGLILISIILNVESLRLIDVIYFQEVTSTWFIFPFFPVFLMFFVSSLVETNRAPFDLPEAEAELVSGYNVEYSSVGFAFFFIAEYANIILMSFLTVIFFLGGWSPIFPFTIIDLGLSKLFWFLLKLVFVLFLFILVRSSLPRYRYDQLMNIGWKYLLPFSLGWVFLVSVFVYMFNV